MKNIITKNLKMLILPCMVLSTLSAATYNDNYRVTDLNKSIEKNDNTFMDEDFQEIVRYEMLWFDGDTMEDASQKTFDKAKNKIKEYEKADKTFKLTIIGHTNRSTDDVNEVTIDSDTYANAIQNWFRDSQDTNESIELSKSYALDVQKLLEDANISKELMYLEYRGGNDELYTNATSKGRELSNGVMLSIYVHKPTDIDSDKDGVFDRYDRCPATPRGSKVDKNGCPVDSDKDGVLDYKDKCPETPVGVKVDAKGCPLDSDRDGVVDYKDRCANTPLGVTIDPHGCAVKSTLNLNFATGSDKILQESRPVVQAFSDFLKKNPAYNVEIIGHTDSRGKAVSNMKLSQRRAAMTKKALVENGIEASRITTKGRGELDPIESNMLKAGRKVNRRIEVKLSLNK
jgi:outer membrane protein OmpA-like peptidoglycan-associated protein